SFLFFFLSCLALGLLRSLPSFPTRRSSDLAVRLLAGRSAAARAAGRGDLSGRAQQPARRIRHRADCRAPAAGRAGRAARHGDRRSEEHTSELQSRENLVCRLLLEKKKYKNE